MQPGVVPGAVYEFHAAKAALGLTPGINSPLTTQAFDTSGNGNHGTLTNFAGESPWAGTGTPADPYRCVLDGVNDYVVLPDLSAAEGWAYSYEVWFKTTAAAGDLITEGNSGSDIAHARLAISGGYLLASIRGSAGTNYLKNGAVTVNNGALHHAVATCGANLEQIYADGAPDGGPLATVTSALAVNLTTIGALRRIATLLYFPGSILGARIYPFALTAAQVAQNYAAGSLWTPAQNLPVIGSPIVKGIGGTP